MAGRTRSTKKLAQRIDLNYFKRLYPIPRWRRILSIGLTALGLLWLVTKQQAFNPGPLAHAHSLLGRNCASCHSIQTAFQRKVTDQACLGCHDGPIHHVQQKFTPSCQECHVEHQGAFRLAGTRDQSCAQCHANFGFDKAHPEFALLGRSDPGTVKFGHQVHLKKDLLGLNRQRVQLKCGDCHMSADGYMAAIDYQKQCAECHPLLFDKRFAEAVPHKKLEIVMDFVVARFTGYIAAHPDEVHMVDPPDPRILRPPLPPARDAAEWISRRVADAQQLLTRKTCKECHASTSAAAAIPSRWFAHAWFNHDAHQMLNCAECHIRAATSVETSDVLIPGIQTCRKCHSSAADSAEARCFECHTYHDWSKEKKVEGRLTIDQ